MGKYSDEIRIFQIYRVPICKTKNIFSRSDCSKRNEDRFLSQWSHSSGIMHQCLGSFHKCITLDSRVWQLVWYIPVGNTHPSPARHHNSHFCWGKYIQNNLRNGWSERAYKTVPDEDMATMDTTKAIVNFSIVDQEMKPIQRGMNVGCTRSYFTSLWLKRI